MFKKVTERIRDLYLDNQYTKEGILTSKVINTFDQGEVVRPNMVLNSTPSFDDTTVLEGKYSMRNPSDEDTGGIATTQKIFRGTVFSWYIYFDLRDDNGILQENKLNLSYQDSTERADRATGGYILYIRKYSDDRFILSRFDDGGQTILDQPIGLSIPTDQWLRVTFKLGFSTIEGTVEQLNGTSIGTASADDTNYQNDLYLGFTCRSDEYASGNHTYMDFITQRHI